MNNKPVDTEEKSDGMSICEIQIWVLCFLRNTGILCVEFPLLWGMVLN